MKTWFVYLFILITTAGTFIPCCAADGCCADQAAIAANHETHDAEGTCSPFFACATCPGFVEITTAIQLAQPIIAKQVHYAKRILFNFSFPVRAFWQPPRSC